MFSCGISLIPLCIFETIHAVLLLRVGRVLVHLCDHNYSYTTYRAAAVSRPCMLLFFSNPHHMVPFLDISFKFISPFYFELSLPFSSSFLKARPCSRLMISQADQALIFSCYRRQAQSDSSFSWCEPLLLDD